MNAAQFIKTNSSALLALITPEGISLTFVLGLAISISLSKNRLKAIAALLAKTIHRTTKPNIPKSRDFDSYNVPRKKPTIANGIAKIVWLNFISEK